MNSSPSPGGASVSGRDVKYSGPSALEINELSWTVVSTVDHMMANVDGAPVDCEEVRTSCRISDRLAKTGANFSSKLLPVWK